MNIPHGEWQLVASTLHQQPGIHKIRAGVDLPPNDAMNTALRITVGGDTVFQHDVLAGQRPHEEDFGATALYPLGENADIRVEVFQDSGQNVEFPPAWLLVEPVC